MIKAVILHGKPSREKYYSSKDSQSNSHWLPWLQNELLQRDILAQTPELWHSFDLGYSQHKLQLGQMGIDEKTIVVAHSYGAGLIIKWLTETGARIKRLVLVAPWLDIEREYGEELEFDFNANLAEQVEQGIHILESTDDMAGIKNGIKFLKENLKDGQYYEFENYGHFTLSSMKTREFPGLLEICLGDNN